MSIKPLFASEKLLAGPPYRGCGISSDWHGTMLATDNEAGQNRYGRQKGKAARRRDLQRGWRAFESKYDDNGWVDRNDIARIHAAMFPGLPQPTPYISTPAWVWDRIGGNAHSIAIDTGAVGASNAIRRYVGPVAHQVVAYKRKTVNGTRWVKIIDPMKGQSDLYTGHWVKWASLRKCALAIKGSNGRVLGFRFPVSKWTREAQMRQRKNDEIVQLNAKHLERVKLLRSRIAAKDTEITALEAQLIECREDVGDAAVEAVLDELHVWEEEQRTALTR